MGNTVMLNAQYVPVGESNALEESGDCTDLKQLREEPGDMQSPENTKQMNP